MVLLGDRQLNIRCVEDGVQDALNLDGDRQLNLVGEN